MPKVTAIPATKAIFSSADIVSSIKKKVAAYARVSTDHEEQQNSYEAQKDYFTRQIANNPDWTFAGMYADEGISATNTKKRDSFNQMIDDALAGKIDLILTKSVSRFARNTVDSLSTIRILKEKGVEVYFEKENIHTLDAKGELLITIMSSLAQEESRSISENTTWGMRKQMADGKYSLCYKYFMGYEKGPDGKMVINEEQAKVVRLIFKLYLDGYSSTAVAEELEKRGIKNSHGGERWHAATILSMLKNEKYMGDVLLQKTFVTDFLTKKTKKNEGELQQYYIENDHPGIVSKEIFEQVQIELKRRADHHYSGKSLYGSKIRCGQCGNWYGSKLWHSNNMKYRKFIYQCGSKYKNDEKCRTPKLEEAQIQKIFIYAANQLIQDKDEIIGNVRMLLEILDDTSALETELEKVNELISTYINKTEILIEEHARNKITADEYKQKYDSVKQKYDEAVAKAESLDEQIRNQNSRLYRTKEFIEVLEESNELITDFSTALWCSLLEEIIVYEDYVTVKFRSGIDIEVNEEEYLN